MVILRVYLVIAVVWTVTHGKDNTTRICSDIDIRNNPENFNLLRGCRAVEGYVRIVLIDRGNETDYEGLSFPELKEITQYLMFYRVAGLRKIGQLFPNLALIRGNDMFLDYGLIIYEMFHLQEVGLKSLMEVTRGSVMIAKNPSLCYVKTIDWNRIAKWDSMKNYVEHNKAQEDCPSTKVCEEAKCQESLCWSKTDCQIQSQELEGCHPLCVGGCSGPGPKDCYSCRKYLTVDEECVESCPNGTYSHLNRRCITADQCHSVAVQLPTQSCPSTVNLTKDKKIEHYVTFNGTCIAKCPSGYEFTPNRKSCQPCRDGKCVTVCCGKNVDNIATAQLLRSCTHIKGSLEISIKNGKHKIVAEELEASLSSIEEIDGYLKIARSFTLINLNFLKNLTVIRGYELDSKKYALVVWDNQNLQELWDWSTKTNFKIENGRIFFHDNPKLCLSHIDKLVSTIHHENITNTEVAQETNGDRFPCNATDIDTYVSVTYPTAIVFEIPPPQYKNNRPPADLRFYNLYYVKVTDKNVTIFDEPDECGDNGWRTNDKSVSHSEGSNDNETIRMVITRLEPNTQYAFYVKTYTLDSIGGQSTIKYAKTLPSQPSAIMALKGYSNASSEIVVQWEPPKKPNGKLTHYVVSGFYQEEDKTVIDQRNYCIKPLVPDKETPTPDLMTHVKSETETCCAENKITYTPKDGFESLCYKSGKYKIPFGNPENDLISCEKYFYSHLYTSPLDPKQGDIGDDVLKNLDSKYVPKRDDKAELKALLEESSQMVVKNESMLKDGTYNTFIRQLNASTNSITLKNLRHYSQYTIEVKVCRERHPEELPNSPWCSMTDYITIRTRKDDLADTITGAVKLETNNQTISLSWDEPKSPNGIIVGYKIEHKRTDVENAQPITECLTRLEHEVSGHSWSINGLSPGKYALKLKAISLAGDGPFTDLIEFNIQEKKSGSFRFFLGIFIILLIILLSIAGFYVLYWRKRISENNFRLVASVNPEYSSVNQYQEDEWEIARENVEYIKELGQGTFGMVYEGLLRPSMTRCAVKTINVPANQSNTNLFLNEASIMKCTSDVHHIVKLLGVVSRGNPPLVVMELMDHGDLKTYLRMTRMSYEHLPPSKVDVIHMAAQIADGMAYLEMRKFVHRDLAARNCMIGDELTVKIGDFGMTRDIYETDYYRKGNKGLLPIRWMAPESLKDGVFSSQSDVWSYGVVLWEIATLAEQPYQGSSNDQVLHSVIAGRKLEAPELCPEILKPIMTSCWKRRPNQRPTFVQILLQLEHILDDKFKQVSFYHSEAAAELRKTMSDYVEMRSNVDDGHSPVTLPSDGALVHYNVKQDNNISTNKSLGESTNTENLDTESQNSVKTVS